MFYGLGLEEVFLIVLVAVVISFILGLWAGRKAYGVKPKKK